MNKLVGVRAGADRKGDSMRRRARGVVGKGAVADPWRRREDLWLNDEARRRHSRNGDLGDSAGERSGNFDSLLKKQKQKREL